MLAVAASLGCSLGATRGAPAADSPAGILETFRVAAPGLNPGVLELALRAVSCADRRLLAGPATLTVIDYSRPSTAPRFWVLDVPRRTVLFEERVAHGRGSGDTHATRFSDEPGSHRSSLGLFVTLEPYGGRHGRSLRLRGLEPGVNEHALDRAIVIHGATFWLGARVAAQGLDFYDPLVYPAQPLPLAPSGEFGAWPLVAAHSGGVAARSVYLPAAYSAAIFGIYIWHPPCCLRCGRRRSAGFARLRIVHRRRVEA
jgi:hypothetical protein